MMTLVLPDGIDIIMGQGAVITGDIPKGIEPIAIITVEPVECTKPQKASFVLVNAPDGVV